jgi:hypothetical protein
MNQYERRPYRTYGAGGRVAEVRLERMEASVATAKITIRLKASSHE